MKTYFKNSPCHKKNHISYILNLLLIILSLSVLLNGCNKDDDSSNWKTIYTDSTVYMSDIHFFSKNIGFVLAGNNNVIDSLRGRQFIYKTTDAGNTWIKYACLFPTNSDGIVNFVPQDQNTLIGVGKSVYKSTDNGYNWTNIYPSHVSGCTVWDIYLKDSLTWLLADCSYITRTIDGGENWVHPLHNTTIPAPFSDLDFPSNSTGYTSGGVFHGYTNYGFIAKTVDGGQNWEYLNPEPWLSTNTYLPAIKVLRFISEDVGFMFTVTGDLYKTRDGGMNWVAIPPIQVTSGYFLTERIGYATDTKTLYKTYNGGNSWHTDFEIPEAENDFFILDMCFLKTGEAYFITSDGRIFKKTE
jgi:photosystem II stability/assembly factor-like uncharacterized protein